MVGSESLPVIDGIEGLVRVGEGGFAVVYRGHQPAFRRDVAVKVLQRTGLGEEDRSRFDRECQAMGALSGHPGIVTLYDAGFTADQQPYLVMPYVADGTLADRIAASGPMSWQEVTDLGVRLCGALETAHRAGVLHRDIKPANILHSQYGQQLSDFGIARIQGGHETRSGVITASVAHAAPEILDGQPPSPQADVYSLASTLFEALTGRAAFVVESDEGLLPMIRRVLTDQPPDLRERGVPGVVAARIETAMAKDPAHRYASAEAFGLALRGAQAVLGIHVADLVIVGEPVGSTVGHTESDGIDTPDTPDAPADTPDTTADTPADGRTATGDRAVEPPDASSGAGATIVVEPPSSAELGDGAPRDGAPRAGAGLDPAPPADGGAVTAPPDESSRGRRRAALAAAGLLGVAALVTAAILISRDDAPDAAPPADSPSPTTVADVTPTTDTQPPTTEAPETTATIESTIADSVVTGETVLAGNQIGVFVSRVGAAHPFVAGLDSIAAELDLEFTQSDPAGDPADELRGLIDRGHTRILALVQDPTSDTASALTAAAEANPDVEFVVVDAVIDSPNVASIAFAEHEGSFVIGAIAALTSTTGRVGFIGGVDNLRIRRYEAGFVAGARHITPTIQVDVRYVPGDGERIDDVALERDTATSMYELGADVVYHAGTAGTGLFQAAAMAPDRWAIGADVDRALNADPELSESILTSMTKSYVEVASDALGKLLADELDAGVVTYGLADGAVPWATTGGRLDALAPQLAALAGDVAAGRIEVSSLVALRALAPLSAECPAEGCFARIIGAELVGSELALTLEANWFMDVAANHVHYFWSPRYAPNQVGTDSAERFGVEVGRWDVDDRYPVYVTEGEVSLVTRTVEDTRLCVTAVDAADNVIDPGLFDCLGFDG